VLLPVEFSCFDAPGLGPFLSRHAGAMQPSSSRSSLWRAPCASRRDAARDGRSDNVGGADVVLGADAGEEKSTGLKAQWRLSARRQRQ
jgi:hypothetical protein